MTERVGRMISLEVGVSDESAGANVAALLMGESLPTPGMERAITEDSVLMYLHAFEVERSADHTGPAVWVGLRIQYGTNAEAGPIAEWLHETLRQYENPMVLRVDTSQVPIEMEAMTSVIRKKVRDSM